VSHRTP